MSGSHTLPPRWPPRCSCVVIESSFDPGERLQAPGSLWFEKETPETTIWKFSRWKISNKKQSFLDIVYCFHQTGKIIIPGFSVKYIVLLILMWNMQIWLILIYKKNQHNLKKNLLWNPGAKLNQALLVWSLKRFMKSVNCSKPGYTSIGYTCITCWKISNIPYNLIFTTKFNDSSILIRIISWDYLNLLVANE